jgi:hypothetical protein
MLEILLMFRVFHAKKVVLYWPIAEKKPTM